MKISNEKKIESLCPLILLLLTSVSIGQSNQGYSIPTSVFDGIGGPGSGETYSQPVGSGCQPTPVGLSGSPHYRNYAGYLFTLEPTAAGGDVTLTFDDDPVVDCDEWWLESGISMRVTYALDDEACSGSCSFEFSGGGLNLWPARLEVDLGGCGFLIESVEVDIGDWCGEGCTLLRLYQEFELVDIYESQGTGSTTVVLNADGERPDMLAVSSCEMFVGEIRILSAGPPVHPSDRDGDAVTDALDNCPDVFNPGQEDSDGNGTGDVCEGTRGDVDGNDAINVLDVLSVVNNILGTVPLEGNALDWADCDGNGQVNVLDALGIINIILGLIPECPGGEARIEITDEALEFMENLKPYLGQEKYSRFMALLSETVEIQLPSEYRLSQNYPNPFNAETAISYQLSAVSDQTTRHSPLVTLKIYNILGQGMRTLVNEIQEPGFYSVVWDGKDASGDEVGSGVYFYTLKAGNFSATKRMVLLR